MPTNVVPLENSKKHYTNAEKNARKEAENSIKRTTVSVVKPVYVKSNKRADYYWKKTVKDLKGIELLDNADAETLGAYCMIVTRLEGYYEDLEPMNSALNQLYDGVRDLDVDAEQIVALENSIAEKVKRIEATERLILQFSSKLGLNPDSRLRLAKRTAEAEADPDADLYG